MYNRIHFSNLICVLLEDIQYKLYKNRNVSRVRAALFSERVVNVWNSLPDTVDFNTLSKFRRSITRVDFPQMFLVSFCFYWCIIISVY